MPQSIPIDANDKISSIRIYGSVEVIVYKDGSFRGASRRFTSSVSNLGRVGWADRISSYQIDERSYGNTSSGWAAPMAAAVGRLRERPQRRLGGAYGGGSRSNWDNSHGGRWTYGEAQDIVRRAIAQCWAANRTRARGSWVDAVMKNNWTQRQLESELMKSAEYRNRR